jgi:hypothetical protein
VIPAGTPLGAVQVSLPGAPVIGLVAPGGQQVNLGKLEGWWDAAPSTGATTQKVNEHGAFLGPGYYGARVIQAEARIDGWAPGDSLAVAAAIQACLDVDTLRPLAVTDELGTRYADVRQEGDPIVVRQGNRVVLSLSMVAPDSRKYSGAQSASTGLPVSSGGFSLPVVLPVTIGGTSLPGSVVLVNNGDVDSNPTFTVTGPVPAGATIADLSGRALRIAEAVPAGRSLVIDTKSRTALLDGVANRTVTGSWPVLRPGSNTFVFNASAYDAGALLTVSYRSAWR